MSFNITVPMINITYLESGWGLFQYANLVSSNLFGVLTLMVIAMITIISAVRTLGFKSGVSQGGFITMILAIIMGVGQVIPTSAVLTVLLSYFTWIGYLTYNNMGGG